MEVALVTCHPMPDLARPEHDLLAVALAPHGITARTVAWDDPAARWDSFALAVVRSTWDYIGRRDAFLEWARRVPRLANPEGVIAWNSHKGYLRELQARGVPVVPTEWISPGDPCPALAALLEARGWPEAVLKPAVSAGAARTLRFRREDVSAAQTLLKEILSGCEAMVQPYLANVETEARGERSLVFVDGELSHAVRRESVLKTGRHGFSRMDPEPADVAVARQVLAAAPPELLYARVDLVPAPTGDPRWLMELEVVEPSLFLQVAPEGARALAAAIARWCGLTRSSESTR